MSEDELSVDCLYGKSTLENKEINIIGTSAKSLSQETN